MGLSRSGINEKIILSVGTDYLINWWFYPYHHVRTSLSVPFCPLPFCPRTFGAIRDVHKSSCEVAGRSGTWKRQCSYWRRFQDCGLEKSRLRMDGWMDGWMDRWMDGTGEPQRWELLEKGRRQERRHKNCMKGFGFRGTLHWFQARFYAFLCFYDRNRLILVGV